MGNILTYSSTVNNGAATGDDKWLKLPAQEFFNLVNLSKEYSKLPAFENTDTPKQLLEILHDNSSDNATKSSQLLADLADLFTIKSFCGLAVEEENENSEGAVKSFRDFVRTLEVHDASIGCPKAKLNIDLANESMSRDKQLVAEIFHRRVRARALLRLHLAIVRQNIARSSNATEEEKVKEGSNNNTNNTNAGGEPEVVKKAVFSALTPAAAQASPKTDEMHVMEILLSANLNVSMSTINGLIGSPFHEAVVREALTSLVSMLSPLTRGLTPFDRVRVEEDASVNSSTGAVALSSADLEPLITCQTIIKWERALSNSSLTFGRDHTSALRPGGASSYPAAMAKIVNPLVSFSVVLTASSRTNNWLTIGLASKDFPASSSNGFGRQNKSYGIQDDRSGSSDASIWQNGSKEATLRKLATGDVVSVVAYFGASEGLLNLCDVILNFGEFRHRFTLPSSSTCEEFVVGATFANDHELLILPLPYSELKKQFEIPSILSSRQCGHDNSHELTRFDTIPPVYAERYPAGVATVSCNGCSRKGINLDKTCFFHCASCSFDLCFACSLPEDPEPVSNVTLSSLGLVASGNAIAPSSPMKEFFPSSATRSARSSVSRPKSSSAAMRSPFVSLGENSLCSDALDAVLVTARSVISNATARRSSRSLMSDSFVDAAQFSSQDPRQSHLTTTFTSIFLPQRKLAQEATISPERLENIALSLMFAYAVLRESLTSILEVVCILAESPRELDLSVSWNVGCEFMKRLFGEEGDVDSPRFRIFQSDYYEVGTYGNQVLESLHMTATENVHIPISRSGVQACRILEAIAEIAAANGNSANAPSALTNSGKSTYAPFAITDDRQLDLLLTFAERGAALLTSRDASSSCASSDILLASSSLKIVFFNLFRVAKISNSTQRCRMLDVHTTGSQIESNSYRDRIRSILDRIIAHPAVNPETNGLGAHAVLFAGIREVLYPKAVEQFTIICELLEKSDRGEDTPCERALVIRLMEGMEGPKLLELNAASGDDGNVGNVERFVKAILLLADRALRGKFHKILDSGSLESAVVASSTEELQEGILHVLEPLAMQTVSTAAHKLICELGDPKLTLVNQERYLGLLKCLIRSAASGVDFVLKTFGINEERPSKPLPSVHSDLAGKFSAVNAEMNRSHVASLIPLVFFATSVLWKDAISRKQRKAMNCLVELFELLQPLHLALLRIQSFESHLDNLREAAAVKSITNALKPDLLPQPVSVGPMPVTVWDVTRSNSSLLFSAENRQCKRPGNISCYPAAFAVVPATQSIFKVVIAEAESSTNWLTIGLAAQGFATSSSDGFGRTHFSWGIADDRSSATEHSFFAASCTRLTSLSRKLRCGDSVAVILDLSIPQVEISVNDGEFSHVFPLDSVSATKNKPEHFVFGATFANDHSLLISPVEETVASGKSIQASIQENVAAAESSTMPWYTRLAEEVRVLQYLAMQQLLERPVSGGEFVHVLSPRKKSDAASNRRVEGIAGESKSNREDFFSRLFMPQEEASDAGNSESTFATSILSPEEDSEDEDEGSSTSGGADDLLVAASESESESEESEESASVEASAENENSTQLFGLGPRSPAAATLALLGPLERNGNATHLSEGEGSSVQSSLATADKPAEPTPEDLAIVHDWLDSVLLTNGVFVGAPPSTSSISSSSASSQFLSLESDRKPAKIPLSMHKDQWLLLHQLTDGPNGLGASQRLVGLMKKFVREDQGTEAGPNHVVHATCAALLWHEGLGEEALALVNASFEGKTLRPSAKFQRIWKRGQSMRRIYPEDDLEISTENSANAAVSNDNDSENSDEVGPPIALMKQFSLPVPEKGAKPLPAATLSAVRRARLLLEYFPAVLAKRDADRDSKWKGAQKADFLRDWVGRCTELSRVEGMQTSENPFSVADYAIQFIQFGPDADLIRRITEERTKLAEWRRQGFNCFHTMFESIEATAIARRTEVMSRLLESLAGMSNSGDASDVTHVDSNVNSSEFRFIGYHYFTLISGAQKDSQKLLIKEWLRLAASISSAAMELLANLDAVDVNTPKKQSWTLTSLEQAVLMALAVVGYDYREFDVDYVLSSGIFGFLEACANCRRSHHVRKAARGSLERLLHLCTQLVAHYSPMYVPWKDENKVYSLSVGTSTARCLHAADLLERIVAAMSQHLSLVETYYLAPKPATASSRAGQDFFYLFEGIVDCDPMEVGLAVSAPNCPNESFEAFKDNCDHSLFLWVNSFDSSMPSSKSSKKKTVSDLATAGDGILVSRMMGTVSPFSFLMIGIGGGKVFVALGNRESVEFSPESREDGPREYLGLKTASFDGICLCTPSPIYSHRWISIGYSVDSSQGLASLWINGTIVDYAPLTPNMLKSQFPFPDMISSKRSSSSLSFFIGQVPALLSAVGRAAFCTVSNVIVSTTAMVNLEVSKVIAGTAPRERLSNRTKSSFDTKPRLKFEEMTQGLKCSSPDDCSDYLSTFVDVRKDIKSTMNLRILARSDGAAVTGFTVGLSIALGAQSDWSDSILFDGRHLDFGIENIADNNHPSGGRSVIRFKLPEATKILPPENENLIVWPAILPEDELLLCYDGNAEKLIISLLSPVSEPVPALAFTYEIDIPKHLETGASRNFAEARFLLTISPGSSILLVHTSPEKSLPLSPVVSGVSQLSLDSTEDPALLKQVVSCWDPHHSDTERLEISNMNTIVYFPGHAGRENSRYSVPLASVPLTQPRAAFTVMIGRNVMLEGMLSIGLAKCSALLPAALDDTQMRNFFPRQSGFGLASNSWGLCASRSDNPEAARGGSFFGANGSMEDTFRQLCEGDIVCCTVDFLAELPWMEIAVNGESVRRFTGLPGQFANYVFGVVLPIEHEILLIADSSTVDALPPPECEVTSSAVPSILSSPKASLSSKLKLPPLPHKPQLSPVEYVHEVTTWDASVFVSDNFCNREISSSVGGTRSNFRESLMEKRDVVRVLSAIARTVKSLTALCRLDNEEENERFMLHWLLENGVLEISLALSLRASSSLVQLAASKLCSLIIPLVEPRQVLKTFLSMGLNFFNSPTFGNNIFGIFINMIGAASLQQGASTFSVHPSAIAARFALECTKSVCQSKNPLWLKELERGLDHCLEESTGAAASLQRCIQAEQTAPPHSSYGMKEPAVCSLFGLLALFNGGFAGVNLIPGASVAHVGIANSISDEFVVCGYSQHDQFGEMLVVARMENDGGVLEASLEEVYSSYLEAEQFKIPPSDVLLNLLRKDPERRHFLAKLLAEILKTETVDFRDFATMNNGGAPLLQSKAQVKTLLFESPHPYFDNTDEMIEISIPGASELIVTFDPQSKTEANYDYCRFLKETTATVYWGQDKYTGSIWPGVNGMEPLRIPADHCHFTFHSDGSNNDWGYKFTVSGSIPMDDEETLRPPFRSLSILRLVKAMTLNACHVLLDPLLLTVHVEDLLLSPMFVEEIFPALLQSLILHNVTSRKTTHGEFDAQAFHEIDLSSVPSSSSSTCHRILQALNAISRVSCSEESLVQEDARPMVSVSLYQSMIDCLSLESSSPTNGRFSEAEDIVLSPGLVAALSAPNQLQVFQCPDVAKLSDVFPSHVSPFAGPTTSSSESVVTAETENSDGEAGIIRYRLKCGSGVTHCVIRSSYSFESPELGSIPNGSVVQTVGRVGDFLRLANGKGFVVSTLGSQISWEKIDSTGMNKSQLVCRSTLYLEQLLLEELGAVVAWKCYALLCKLFSQSSLNVLLGQRNPDVRGILVALLRSTGLGRFALPKISTEKKRVPAISVVKTTPMLSAFKKMMTSSIHASQDTWMILVLTDIVTNIFNRVAMHAASDRSALESQSQAPKLPVVVLESKHDYENNTDWVGHISIPGARGLEIVFDEMTSTERNYDFVCFYGDPEKKNLLAGKYSGRKSSTDKNWPGVGDRPPLMLEGRSECWISFITDGSNTDWGWKLTASEISAPAASMDKSEVDVVVYPLTGSLLESAELDSKLIVGSLAVEFGNGIKKPSLAMALALFELLMESSFLNAEFLFTSTPGVQLLRGLMGCSEAVGSSHPMLAKSYFDAVTRVSLLYRDFCSQIVDPASINGASERVMTAFSNQVLGFCEKAIESKKSTASSLHVYTNRTLPVSSLMQSLAQATVEAAACTLLCASESTVPQSPASRHVGSSDLQIFGSGYKLTCCGRGVSNPSGSSPILAFGQVFAEIVFPLKSSPKSASLQQQPRSMDDEDFTIGEGVDFSPPGIATTSPNGATRKMKAAEDMVGKTFTYFVQVLKKLNNASLEDPLRIGVALLHSGIAENDGTSQLFSLGTFPGSLAWVASRSSGGSFFTFVNKELDIVEMDCSTTISEGDIISIALELTDEETALLSFSRNGVLIGAFHARSCKNSSLVFSCLDAGRVVGAANGNRSKIAGDDKQQTKQLAIAVSLGLASEVKFLFEGEVPELIAAMQPKVSGRQVHSSRSIAARIARSTVDAVFSSSSSGPPPPPVDGPQQDDLDAPSWTSYIASGISNRPFVGTAFHCWDANISDPALEFSEGHTIAKRRGAVSCYPASLIEIPSSTTENVFSLTCKLIEGPPVPNSMSFGIAYQPSFRCTGSDGFGYSRDSWGISEQRASREAKIVSNRIVVGTFRKMAVGDQFTVCYSRRAGTAWLIVNETEFCQEFRIHPPGQLSQNLVLGATYCNDHSLKILSIEPPSTTGQPAAVLESTATPVSPKKPSVLPPLLLSWDTNLSQSSLVFTNSNRTARRPGSASCYPAALVHAADSCALIAVLENAPQANNTMSFGIATTDFQNSGQQAFGERVQSWGIFNNRSESSRREQSKVFASGTSVGSFRRMESGDVFILIYRKQENTATLIVNDNECCFTFALPEDRKFVIGATFCNDHVLTILEELPTSFKSVIGARAIVQEIPAEDESSIPTFLLPPCLRFYEQKQLTATSVGGGEDHPDLSEHLMRRKEHFFGSSSRYKLRKVRLLTHAENAYLNSLRGFHQILQAAELDPASQIRSINCAPLNKILPSELHAYSSLRTIASLLLESPEAAVATRNFSAELMFGQVLPKLMQDNSVLVRASRVSESIQVAGAVSFLVNVGGLVVPQDCKLVITALVDLTRDPAFVVKEEVTLLELHSWKFQSPSLESMLLPTFGDCKRILTSLASHLKSPKARPEYGDVHCGDSVVRGESWNMQSQECRLFDGGPGGVGDVVFVESVSPVLANVTVKWRETGKSQSYEVKYVNIEGRLVQCSPVVIRLCARGFQPFSQLAGLDPYLKNCLIAPFGTREIRITLSGEDLEEGPILIPIVPLYSIEAVGMPELKSSVRNILERLSGGWDHKAVNSEGNMQRRRRLDYSVTRIADKILTARNKNNEGLMPDRWSDVFNFGTTTPSSALKAASDILPFPVMSDVLTAEESWAEERAESSANAVAAVGRSAVMSSRYTLIQMLNLELFRCFDLINLASLTAPRYHAISHGELSAVSRSTIARTVSELISQCRDYLFSWTKEIIIQKGLSASIVESSPKFELVISRTRAAKFLNKGDQDSSGRWSVFGQAFQRLHAMPAASWRRSGQLWDTVFAGERAQDAGGPYREAWSAICMDLMSSHLPLLVPCPNAKAKIGQNQETYMLNSDCIHSAVQLEMLCFMGKLMGSAARNKNYLDIYLSPIVWKSILRFPLTLEDIRDVDVHGVNFLNHLRARGHEMVRNLASSHLSAEDLAADQLAFHHEYNDLSFSVSSKAGSVIELHPGGSKEPVEYGESVLRYCDELECFWLEREQSSVAEAVRAGIECQLPGAILNLMRWEELQEMVCGNPRIDLDLLQSATEYERSCSATDEHIVWFWDILRKDFTEEDRKALIRFTWGRTRLPLTKSAFSQQFKIQGFSKGGPAGADNYLPVSHTCFFSIELPRYSSREVMKQKLLYAIHHCTVIDGDDTGAGIRAAALGMEL